MYQIVLQPADHRGVSVVAQPSHHWNAPDHKSGQWRPGNGCSTCSWARGNLLRGPPAVLIFRRRPSPCRRLSAGAGDKCTAAGVRGQSLLLILAVDLPSRINRRFPPLVVLLSGVIKSSPSDHLSSPPTIRATCEESLPPTSGIYLPCGRNYHRRSTILKSQRAVAGRGCGACVTVPGSRHFNMASNSVGAERGGGACAGMARSRRFSIISRLANPTEGPVMAVLSARATARSPHTPAEPSLASAHTSPVIGIRLSLA